MVRSRWIKAVMATLVSTGLALGQSTTPTSPQAADDATGRIITVHEAGKPAQKCRVIKWWVNDKGCKVWQVQALDTGEMMTIVAEGAPVMGEAPSEGRLRSLRTQIFHWSRDRVPPPGAPTAPVAVCDSGCSPTGPMLSAGSRLPIVSNGPCASDTTCPTCTPTTGGGWSRSTGVPCDNCKPSTGSSVASSGWGSGSGPSGNSSGTTWGPTASAGTGGSPYAGGGSTGGDTRIPVIINVPPSTAQSGTPGTTGMPALPAIESKGPGTFPSAVTTTTTPVPPKPPTETAKPPEIKVTQAEPSALSKWRESWGKSESPRQPAGDGTKGAETKKPQPDAKKPGAEAKVPAALSLPKVDTLPHADTTKPDPLLGDPTQYAKKPIEEKLQGKGSLPPADPVPAPGVRSDGSAPGRAVVTPVPGTGEQLSGGFKSVTDSGAVGYATVPIVTLPAGGMGRPPMPQWQVPQGPPQPINPGRGNAPEALQGGIGYNAFTPRELTPPAPGTPAQSALGNAFSSDLDPVQPAAHAMPAGPPAPGVFGPGYPPYPMMAQGGPRPMSPMLPAAPYGPVVRLPAPPVPPNPTGQGPQLAMLPPPQASGVMQAGYQAPATGPTAVVTPPQLAGMLHDALYPSQREWAAERLAAFDWKQNDAAVQALTRAVREDPAATVRATCVRALAKMKANTYPVVSVVLAAKNDPDTRVRVEADEAAAILAPGAAGAGPGPRSPSQTIQPTGAVLPQALPAPAPAGGSLPALPTLPPASK